MNRDGGTEKEELVPPSVHSLGTRFAIELENTKAGHIEAAVAFPLPSYPNATAFYQTLQLPP